MHNLSQIFSMVRFRFFRSRLLMSFLWHLWRCFLSVANNLGQPGITLASIKLIVHHQYLLWSLSAWNWLLYKVKCTFWIIREVQHWWWHTYIFIGGPDCQVIYLLTCCVLSFNSNFCASEASSLLGSLGFRETFNYAEAFYLAEISTAMYARICCLKAWSASLIN